MPTRKLSKQERIAREAAQFKYVQLSHELDRKLDELVRLGRESGLTDEEIVEDLASWVRATSN